MDGNRKTERVDGPSREELVVEKERWAYLHDQAKQMLKPRFERDLASTEGMGHTLLEIPSGCA